MLCFFSVVLTTTFFIGKETFLMWFGASSETLPFANDYLSIYLIGTFFVQLSIGLNPFITAQGKAKTAMVSMMICSV
jgi:Na+-driven multidrug efflux pump